MPDALSGLDPDQKKTLRNLRLLWAVLVIEIFILGGAVYTILAGNQPAAEPSPTLLTVALAAVVGTSMLGYFLRMQAYKKHWIGNRIDRPGYMTGNLMLMAFAEIGALAAAVCAFLSGRPGPELLTLVLPLVLMLLNFPNGKPMLPDSGQLPQRLDR